MQDNKQEVLNFWFGETSPQQWFQKNDEFDVLIKSRFETIYEFARDGVLEDWENSADGALALCLLLDQFPRNMFRGDAKAYATDKKALVIAKKAIHKGFDQVLEPMKRRFLYMPFQHSENLNDQRKSVELFNAMKDEDPTGYKHALRHLEVIEKFDRFPHRNAALGRSSTPEEEEFINTPGTGF